MRYSVKYLMPESGYRETGEATVEATDANSAAQYICDLHAIKRCSIVSVEKEGDQ